VTVTPPVDCWFLTGPTASGKTGLALELARQIHAEIISLDSMALYRGMEVGTAKPTPEERAAVPHHLIDLVEPHEEFTLARYVEEAHRAIEDIRGRGGEVLFVGGTPLYLKAMLRGIFEGPPADWELRRKLAEEAERDGADALHRRLAEVDPATAERLHPNDQKRVIRALEVYAKTGQSISDLQRQFDVGRPADQCRVFVLDWPRDQLYRRIDERVEAMFAAGLVDEVRRLLGVGRKGTGPFSQSEKRDCPLPPLSRTARQAVGYREVIEHLGGRHDLAETVELVQRHTRQLAKRQMTWFRSLSECRFVRVEGELDVQGVTRRILSESSL